MGEEEVGIESTCSRGEVERGKRGIDQKVLTRYASHHPSGWLHRLTRSLGRCRWRGSRSQDRIGEDNEVMENNTACQMQYVSSVYLFDELSLQRICEGWLL
uniref:Uncharacterized protein n=1 Tax=Oryza rufipogon TaxID=4529 RepID=A0A0E0MX30_ORYRU